MGRLAASCAARQRAFLFCMLAICGFTLGSTVEVEVAANADVTPILATGVETTHPETVLAQPPSEDDVPMDITIEDTVAVASSTWQDFHLLRNVEEHFSSDNSSRLASALLSLCNEHRHVITAAIKANHSLSQTDAFLNASASIGEACYFLGELHIRGWDGQPFTDMQFPPLPYKPSALSSPLHFMWSKLGQPVVDALGTALWGALPHHGGGALRDGVHYFLQPNTSQAVEYYKASAELGNPDAHYVLGVLHAHGMFGFPQSEAKAVLHYYFSASGGNLDAHRALAHRHEQGIGVPQSCTAAVQYTEEVAKKAAADLEASHGLLQALPLQSLDYLDDEFIEDLEQRYRVEKQAESQVLAYYHNMADKGDVSAHVALGHLYLLGAQSATQDFLLASEHFHAAAEHGDPLSIANLGLMYAHGIGVEADYHLALEFLTDPSVDKIPAAHNTLGYLYLHGLGVPQNFGTAFFHFEKSSGGPYADGTYNMAMMHLNGTAPAGRDFKVAYQLFQQAVTHGHALSFYRLGLMQLHGIGTQRDCFAAMQSFGALLQRMRSHATLKNGYKLIARHNRDGALLEFLRAAEQGSEVAQWNAAFLLENGYISPSIAASPDLSSHLHANTTPSTSAAKTAASSEFTTHSSFEEVARTFFSLPPAPTRDIRARALRLFHRSASQKNGESSRIIGDYYFYGLGGLEVNYREAASRYLSACTQHVSQACFDAGWMYEFGLGLDRDEHLAKRYYDLTVENTPHKVVPAAVKLALWRMEARKFVVEHVVPFFEDLGIDLMEDVPLVPLLLGVPPRPAPVVKVPEASPATASPHVPPVSNEDGNSLKPSEPSTPPAPVEQQQAAEPPVRKSRKQEAFELARQQRLKRLREENVVSAFIHSATNEFPAAFTAVQRFTHGAVQTVSSLLGFSLGDDFSADESFALFACVALVLVVLLREVRRHRQRAAAGPADVPPIPAPQAPAAAVVG